MVPSVGKVQKSFAVLVPGEESDQELYSRGLLSPHSFEAEPRHELLSAVPETDERFARSRLRPVSRSPRIAGTAFNTRPTSRR